MTTFMGHRFLAKTIFVFILTYWKYYHCRHLKHHFRSLATVWFSKDFDFLVLFMDDWNFYVTSLRFFFSSSRQIHLGSSIIHETMNSILWNSCVYMTRCGQSYTVKIFDCRMSHVTRRIHWHLAHAGHVSL